ncbi:Gpr1 family protein [Cantharellus anzutake]|uniref:Gpr1 family protein n=1 Tax=Cantharellus anzutake TaxID=1750568 RepID=UPI001903ABAF|nr:Gpr1 family protein [Cantharellus anzutake]KAF8324285.1 Gpr1 family protein [Cantharellus anzutake]
MADIETKGPQNGGYYDSSAPSPHLRKLANPAPLGLFSFASTTLILSFVNVQARGVTEPNIVVGMALGCGGLAQLLAGMWEFACGNTFGATAFSSYGAFWISYALIFIPGTGILEAYAEPKHAHDLDNAVAFYLTAWFIFTFCMFLASLRSSVAIAALFFFLDMTFMLLMIGAYITSEKCTKAGGGLGLVTAAIAYYAAASGLMTPEASYFGLPVIDLPKYRSA